MSFVRSLELEDYSGSFHGNGHIAGNPESEGLVNAGSLIPFTAHLNSHQKEDVLNSIGTLLAQLAANKKYDRFSQTDDWYKFCTDVMGNIRDLTTNRRLSHDGAVGSPYSPASSSCGNLNL